MEYGEGVGRGQGGESALVLARLRSAAIFVGGS